MYTLKFQAPQKQKALFRIGQKVTCDYYLGSEVYKVAAKEWDLNGTLYYTIRRSVGTDKFDFFQAKSGIRQKYLNKAA